MDRRIFLAAVLGAAPVAAVAGPGRDAAADAARIGRAVLRAGAAERDAAGLRAALGLDSSAEASLDGTWRAAIRADYAGGRIVHVEDWVLARTEARLCALVALSAGAGA
ncbi:hypothetical protein [Jannaschia sp. W003]|uniref:hypothetical protein n=1 Tax=Jannaschia sp. W003 TaxID=2867012 RepID=UPI0021A5090A|nr:hypothetical protein [Jannaschia sp. W003]UWQ21567.1 hypothetical protein K3554_00590 [Jannaschia sp. W003]